MIALVTLWDVSLLLCLAGALALLGLIAVRGAAEPAGRRRGEARRILAPLLIGSDAAPRRLTAIESKVATQLAIELAELTRGSDRDAMLGTAERLGVPSRLARQLRSHSAQKRLTAAETLALFPGWAGEAFVALEDRNPDVRLGAALALAHRDDAPAPGEIVRKLRLGSEEHSLLLISLMRDLAARDSAAVERLIFDGETAEETRLAAIDALAEQGHAHAPVLAYVAQEAWSNPVRHARALAALGRAAHPAAQAAIGDGLESESAVVRAAAAEAAGNARLTGFAPLLGSLLSDPEWRVRLSAGLALVRLGSRGIDTMRDIAAGSDATASKAAATILAETGLAEMGAA